MNEAERIDLQNNNSPEIMRNLLSKCRVSDYRQYYPDLNFDPNEQLVYIERTVEEFRRQGAEESDEMQSIEERLGKYKNDCDQKFVYEAARNYKGLSFMRQEALRANMQIAMLAPAIENLYKKSLYILIEKKLGKKELSEIFTKNKGFKRGKPEEGGAVNRVMQALDMLMIQSKFCPNIEECLSALFGYRNALFHNGLEWSKDECDAFNNQNHQKKWFTSHSNSCRPYFFLPTNKFIDELINLFAESMDVFARSMRDLNEKR